MVVWDCSNAHEMRHPEAVFLKDAHFILHIPGRQTNPFYILHVLEQYGSAFCKSWLLVGYNCHTLKRLVHYEMKNTMNDGVSCLVTILI